MQKQAPKLVIMAAGMGSRFGGLKQMEPVDQEGHSIIDFSMYDARRAGFRDLVFIIKREHEALFRERIGTRMERFFNVEYVYQELTDIPDGCAVPEGRVKPWGTGQAVACCRNVLHGPFAVINSDDFYGRTAFSEIYEFLRTNEDEHCYAMVGYRVRNTVTTFGSVLSVLRGQRLQGQLRLRPAALHRHHRGRSALGGNQLHVPAPAQHDLSGRHVHLLPDVRRPLGEGPRRDRKRL